MVGSWGVGQHDGFCSCVSGEVRDMAMPAMVPLLEPGLAEQHCPVQSPVGCVVWAGAHQWACKDRPPVGLLWLGSLARDLWLGTRSEGSSALVAGVGSALSSGVC